MSERGRHRWLREPLVHFMAGGLVLFGAFAAFGPGSDSADDATTIVVDRRSLLTFLQYRANAFEPEIFGAALDGMSDAELEEVIDAYVEEEVLYREARALGLEQSDNIIRQRMVQKMNFIMTDLAATGGAVDEEELASYFDEHREAYAIQPWATFTHVFFDATERGDADARAAAAAALTELNALQAGFNDAPAYGDRFPFLRNYVERTFEYIASHFGYEFAAGLEQLEPSDSVWRGPLRSAYGWHLVLMPTRVERDYPALDEVRGDVERDYASELSARALAGMTAAIRERYRIEVRDIRTGAAPPSPSPSP